MTSTIDQTTDPAAVLEAVPDPVETPTDILLGELDDCIYAIRQHVEGILEEGRAFGRLVLGAPRESEHRTQRASRIPRLTQVMHEDGWWNVASIVHDEDGVTLTLTRVGWAPLELKVDPDHPFTTCEIF